MSNDFDAGNGRRRVLIVEDEPRLRAMLVRALQDMEFTASAVGSAEEGLRRLEQEESDIVLTDLNLPGMGGLELCRVVRERWPGRQLIILTGYGDLDAAKQAIRMDVADFLTKPCSLSDLEASLDRAVRRRMHQIMPRAIDLSIMQDDDAAIPDDSSVPQTLRELEREHILEALRRHDGNRAAAAWELGISERTLYYRIKEYQRQGHLVP